MAKTSNACLRLNVLFRNIIILRQDNIIVASFADILSPRHAISLPTNVRGGGSLRDGPKECLLTWLGQLRLQLNRSLAGLVQRLCQGVSIEFRFSRNWVVCARERPLLKFYYSTFKISGSYYMFAFHLLSVHEESLHYRRKQSLSLPLNGLLSSQL